MEKAHVQILLQGIDKQIEVLKKRLADLEAAREAFVKQHDNAFSENGGHLTMGSVPRFSRRRLPAGIPQKWVLEALDKQSRATIPELNDLIEQAHGRKLADGTIRRVLDILKANGEICFRVDEGTWELIRKDDDDLPY